MRFYRIGRSKRGPLSINRRARFKEAQTPHQNPFFVRQMHTNDEATSKINTVEITSPIEILKYSALGL